MSKNRKGNFKLGRKTEKKRFAKWLETIKEFVRRDRSQLKRADIWKRVPLMLTGHFRYYGVSDNIKQINTFRYHAKRILFKWLNRRSQKRSMNWKEFSNYEKIFPLPRARIHCNLYQLAKLVRE